MADFWKRIFKCLGTSHNADVEVKKQQMVIIVTGRIDSDWDLRDNTDVVDAHLRQGWRVVSATPMGAYGFGYRVLSEESDALMNDVSNGEKGFASLLVLERRLMTASEISASKGYF